MATYILREALVFKNGTGFTTNLADVELIGTEPRTITFSIPQALATTSNVEFDDITLSSKVIIDNDSLIIQENRITGSFTQTGNLITSDTFIHNGHATIGGIITAQKIVSELTQSATFTKKTVASNISRLNSLSILLSVNINDKTKTPDTVTIRIFLKLYFLIK